MSIKKHPFFQAPPGAVFAILIVPGKWGYVRFFRGRSMAVLSVVGEAPQLPRIDWKHVSSGWIFFSFAPNKDATEAVPLGIVPFDDAESEWPPPCYDPPDVIQNCYQIHENGRLRQGDENDVRGMSQCLTVTPAQLAEFLRERLEAGELHSVD